MQKILPTFEEGLVSRRARRHAALANLALLGAKISRDEVLSTIEDIKQVHPWIGSVLEGGAVRFDRIAKRVSAGVLRPRVLASTLFLPGPCPLRCPGCITSASTWKPLDEHFEFERLRPALEALRGAGMRLIRITGEGEPTLARSFLPLVRWARPHGIKVVTCTNGMMPSEKVLEEFRVNESMYFLVKLLSEDPEVQNKLAPPASERGWVNFYEHPVLGPAPAGFIGLNQIAPERVGFRITVSSANVAATHQILHGPKAGKVPMFIGPVEEAGEAAGHHELVPDAIDIPYTRFLKDPNWTLWSVAVNAAGEVIFGMPREAVMPRGLPFVHTADPAKVLRGFFRPDSDYVGELLGTVESDWGPVMV